jgi:hypothetical protein
MGLSRGICVAVTLLAIMTAQTEAQVIVEPERTEGLLASPSMGQHNLVTLSGPGDFVSAEVVKQGGSNNLTFVSLDIDGKNIVSISFAALLNTGLTTGNPYGLVLVKSAGDPKTLTIGFPTPLRYKSKLTLAVTVKETGVVQVLANVSMGKRPHLRGT